MIFLNDCKLTDLCLCILVSFLSLPPSLSLVKKRKDLSLFISGLGRCDAIFKHDFRVWSASLIEPCINAEGNVYFGTRPLEVRTGQRYFYEA